MHWTRRLFFWAGIYGILVIAPQYFLEGRIGIEQPPAITHPEYFYGFIGVGLAWQVAFLLISLDPPRYRLLILPGILEKFSFGGAVFVLLAQQRVPALLAVFAAIDIAMGLAFALAYQQLGKTP